MKTSISHADEPGTRLSLHHGVDQLLKTSVAATNNNKNTIVNNISPELYVTAHDAVIMTVIEKILQGVTANASDSVIYITAKELYGNMIEVKIKDENCYNTYAVALSLQEAVPLAERIGGYLDITNQKQRITTIEFRFPIEKDQMN
jgi:hypothetical protein